MFRPFFSFCIFFLLLFSFVAVGQQLDLQAIKESIKLMGGNSESVLDAVSGASPKAQALKTNIERQVYIDTLQMSKIKQQDSVVNRSNVFGIDFFTNSTNGLLSMNVNVATPTQYQIGPRDEMIISVSGLQTFYFTGTVSLDGILNIPGVGAVALTGVDMEGAKSIIQKRMIQAGYLSLANHKSELSVSIGNIRTIKVMVVGEVHVPGSYAVPSLATVFNVLLSAKGPTEKGSFRKVQLIRNNKLYKEVDLYPFFMGGNRSDNIALQDQDIIYVPFAKKQVNIRGEIKRPYIYELTDEDDQIENIIEYAAGFTPNAYRKQLKVFRETDSGISYVDVSKEMFSTFKLAPYDEVLVEVKTEKFSNYADLQGQVYRPGKYAIVHDKTGISELIQRAGGLMPNSSANNVLIFRSYEGLSSESIQVDLSAIMSGKQKDVLLHNQDKIIISRKGEIQLEATISIQGEVRREGVYAFAQKLKVRDAILLAGGFSEPTASYRVEVSSRINIPAEDRKTNAAIASTALFRDLLELEKSDLELKPYDVITVYKNPSIFEYKPVYIEGEVIYPGTYTIQRKTDKVYDILQRAGGVTDYAYLEGAYIKRHNYGSNLNSSVMGILKAVSSKDSSSRLVYEKRANQDHRVIKIPLDVKKILKRPSSIENIAMVGGDTIIIPKMYLTVKVSGEVHNPTLLPYKPSRSFKYYFRSAGGVGVDAKKNKSFIIYANGKGQTSKSFFFFTIYPKVRPGSEIFVPSRSTYPSRLGETTAIIATVSSVITSSALIYNTFLK